MSPAASEAPDTPGARAEQYRSYAEYTLRIVVGEHAAGIKPLLRREEAVDVGYRVEIADRFGFGEKHLAPVGSCRKRPERLRLDRAQETLRTAVPRVDVDVNEHHVTAVVWAEQDALCGTDSAARVVRMPRRESGQPGKILFKELRERRELITRYRELHVQPIVPVECAKPDPPEQRLAAAPIVKHAIAEEYLRSERDDDRDLT